MEISSGLDVRFGGFDAQSPTNVKIIYLLKKPSPNIENVQSETFEDSANVVLENRKIVQDLKLNQKIIQDRKLNGQENAEMCLYGFFCLHCDFKSTSDLLLEAHLHLRHPQISGNNPIKLSQLIHPQISGDNSVTLSQLIHPQISGNNPISYNKCNIYMIRCKNCYFKVNYDFPASIFTVLVLSTPRRILTLVLKNVSICLSTHYYVLNLTRGRP